MNYKYFNNDNFEDFACGRVIYHKSKMPSFPVRLAGEIFMRCVEHLGKGNEIILYDPCCGGGYMLTVLGLLNPEKISTIIGSDIDEVSLSLAKSNLSLLSKEGLIIRKKQLEKMLDEYNKVSHREAISSIDKFMDIIEKRSFKTNTQIFKADILDKMALVEKSFKADLIIADVPYGNLVSWNSAEKSNNVDSLLDNILPVVHKNTIVALVTDKSQRVKNERFKRLEKFNAGTRRVEIVKIKELG